MILRLHTPGDNEDPSQPGAWGLTAVWPQGAASAQGIGGFRVLRSHGLEGLGSSPQLRRLTHTWKQP